MLTETQKQIAEVFRIALRCSCCQSEDVIAWADEIISTNSNPDYDFIEISTSGSVHNLISKLRGISTSSDSYSALRTVLGRMYEISSKDKQKLADFAGGLYQIAIENQYNLPEDLLFCNHIEDTYDLAYSGIYGNLSDVEKDFMNFLKAYWKEQSSTNSWYAG